MRLKITCIFLASFLFMNLMHSYGQKTNDNTKNGTFDDVLNNADKIVDVKPNGSVNWTDQYVEARGESVIDTIRFRNKAQARAMATRGAVVVAQRNLLEIINGVRIVGETKVVDMIATNDYVYSRVDGIIKGAQMVGDPVENYGLITVTLKVPLYEKNGLAPAVVDNLPKPIDPKVDPNGRGNNGVIVDSTKKFEPKNDKNKNKIDTSKTKEEFTNFAFKVNGKNYDPALFPLVVDEKGEVLLDFTKIYDPTKGQFPKILKQSKNILEAVGMKKGVKVIDVIEASNGKLVVSTMMKKQVDWVKVADNMKKVGKLLLLLI